MNIIQKYKTKREIDRTEKKKEKEFWKEKRATIRKEAEGKARIKGNTERQERIKLQEKERAERKFSVGVKKRSASKTLKKAGAAAKKGAVNYCKKQHEINQNEAKKKAKKQYSLYERFI